MANEAEILSILQTGTMMTLHVADLAAMTFAEQLAMVRHSNVLVGIHGAGLMFIMFAAEEVSLPAFSGPSCRWESVCQAPGATAAGSRNAH
jgi:hypothetical protein